MSSSNEPTIVGVKETRMRDDGKLEGLVELSDGTEEWREPSSVTIEGHITRADGSVEDVDIKITSIGGTNQ